MKPLTNALVSSDVTVRGLFASRFAVALAFALALAAGGCRSTMPQELVDARAAYARASTSSASQLAPADLHVAKADLDDAEASYDREGDSYETRDRAYAAQRRAEIAEVRARTMTANIQREQANALLSSEKDQQVRLTSAELQTARQQAAVEAAALQTEKQAREDAERRANQASHDLAAIASVKQESRGMVITLLGSVLFASGKSELLATARAKLSQVADTLGKLDTDSKIRIEGHTDSQGAADSNQSLSQKRAEAVRTYLTSHGIAQDRIDAEGFGPTRPVADNATPEGRADNRRVEIIVEPATKRAQ
jgi:outer membrane protein OmpA-like peptidoglycan-associated protein